MDAPAWFKGALAAPVEQGFVEVEGCPIHTLRWGERGRPGLLLVHGGAAHAQWWSFLAPLLAAQGPWHYDVLALDLSGHGESGRRERYHTTIWAREVVAAAADARFPGPPVVIGHSMGGMVAIVAAALFGEQLAGAIIVDSPVRRQSPETEEAKQGRSFKQPGVYPDAATAQRHFRLIPAQPCANDFILEHIARTSLKQTSEGWTWKFDPRVFADLSQDEMSDHLRGVRCRVALLRGEFSTVVPPETADYMFELLDRAAPVVEIPQAYHHLLLDQPLAFVAAVRALLADWDHSVPRRERPAAPPAR